MRDMEEGKETLFDGCTKVKPKKDLEKYTDMVLSPQQFVVLEHPDRIEKMVLDYFMHKYSIESQKTDKYFYSYTLQSKEGDQVSLSLKLLQVGDSDQISVQMSKSAGDKLAYLKVFMDFRQQMVAPQ